MNKHLIYSICITLLISCNSQRSSLQETDVTEHSFSGSYRPAAFAEDDRVKKVKELASNFHQLIEEHAADRKIAGIAYGVVVDDSLVIASSTGLINLDKQLAATKNSSFRIASMTKSFTAMAIMKLRDEGKLFAQ